MLKFLANTPNLNPETYHSLKQIFVGSALINESLIEMVKRRLPKTNIIQCELIFSFEFFKNLLNFEDFKLLNKLSNLFIETETANRRLNQKCLISDSEKL